MVTTTLLWFESFKLAFMGTIYFEEVEEKRIIEVRKDITLVININVMNKLDIARTVNSGHFDHFSRKGLTINTVKVYY